MVNVRGTKQALENALIDQDPRRLATVFVLDPAIINGPSSTLTSIRGAGGEPRKHNPQSFMVEDKDCGVLLTSLLDAAAAGEAVSNVNSCATVFPCSVDVAADFLFIGDIAIDHHTSILQFQRQSHPASYISLMMSCILFII